MLTRPIGKAAVSVSGTHFPEEKPAVQVPVIMDPPRCTERSLEFVHSFDTFLKKNVSAFAYVSRSAPFTRDMLPDILVPVPYLTLPR